MKTQSIVTASLGVAGTGAALMFFLDPSRGNRRRSLVADKTTKFVRLAGRTIVGTAQDVSNRTHGVAALFRSRFSDEPPSDEVLAERVRSKIGRIVSHPHEIEVSARHGAITLRGHVPRNEVRELLSRVSSIADVEYVRSQLKTYSEDAGRWEESTRWRAGMRDASRSLTRKQIALAATGCAVALLGARRGGFRGRLMAAFGAGLLGSELAETKLSFLGHRLKAELLAR